MQKLLVTAIAKLLLRILVAIVYCNVNLCIVHLIVRYKTDIFINLPSIKTAIFSL